MKLRYTDGNNKFYYANKEDILEILNYKDGNTDNAIVRIKGSKYLFRGRSEMIVLSEDHTKVFLSFKNGTYDIPGGSWDLNDKDHKKSAIRETQEEARINVKNVSYCCSYIRIPKQMHPWVAANVPKELQWNGYYSELYIGTYNSKYKKHIDEEDKDEIYDNGKFYDIKEVYDSLNQFHKDFLTNYVNEATNMSNIISSEKRKECEELIYRTFSAIDPSGANTEYYQKLFADMSDAEFTKLISGRLPFRYHVATFDNEPKMPDIFKAFKVLNKPLMEKVKLPYLAKNSSGEPIESKECLVGYLNIKRLKQMLTKKNNTAIEISKREMKLTGRLQSGDKGGLESGKEFEGAMALGLENTTAEYARVKAAAMKAKAEAYQTINVKGEVSFDDIDTDKTDSISKNAMNVYLIGANLHSNLIDENYYNPQTLDRKAKRIERDY